MVDEGRDGHSRAEEVDRRLDCRRLMAWLREIGLESVNVFLQSDNEPALTSMIVECDEGDDQWKA